MKQEDMLDYLSCAIGMLAVQDPDGYNGSNATKAIRQAIDQLRWRSVEDELPELEASVLLFDEWKSQDGTVYKDVRVGYLSEYTTHRTSAGTVRRPEWGGTEFAFNITHWKPLPEQP